MNATHKPLQAPNAPFFGWLPPVWAALFRAVVHSALTAALPAMIAVFEGWDAVPEQWAFLPAIAVLLLRAAEGPIDQWGNRNRVSAPEPASPQQPIPLDPNLKPVLPDSTSVRLRVLERGIEQAESDRVYADYGQMARILDAMLDEWDQIEQERR